MSKPRAPWHEYRPPPPSLHTRYVGRVRIPGMEWRREAEEERESDAEKKDCDAARRSVSLCNCRLRMCTGREPERSRRGREEESSRRPPPCVRRCCFVVGRLFVSICPKAESPHGSQSVPQTRVTSGGFRVQFSVPRDCERSS